jgi:hypothetical protein
MWSNKAFSKIMNQQDKLSKLLQQWEPHSPIKTEKFAADTIRAIRQSPPASFGQHFASILQGIVDSWLPSPNIFVPAAMILVLAITGLHWKSATDKGITFASLRWQESVGLPSLNANTTEKH